MGPDVRSLNLDLTFGLTSLTIFSKLRASTLDLTESPLSEKIESDVSWVLARLARLSPEGTGTTSHRTQCATRVQEGQIIVFLVFQNI